MRLIRPRPLKCLLTSSDYSPAPYLPRRQLFMTRIARVAPTLQLTEWLPRLLQSHLSLSASLVGTKSSPWNVRMHRMFVVIARLRAALHVLGLRPSLQQSPWVAPRNDVQVPKWPWWLVDETLNERSLLLTERLARLVITILRGGRLSRLLLWWHLLTRRHRVATCEQVFAWKNDCTLVDWSPTRGSLANLLLLRLHFEWRWPRVKM